MKRPSDRKSVYLRVRLTKAERATLNKQRKSGESMSDLARRKLLTQDALTIPPINREALAKMIASELNFDAHDLGQDPDNPICTECLRMADAVIKFLTIPEEK